MDSPVLRAVTNASIGVQTPRKRRAASRSPSPVELTASAAVATPVKPRRILPVWNRAHTPPTSQESVDSQADEDEDSVVMLQRALDYLDRRISAAKDERAERNAVSDVTPKGSQDSDLSLGSNQNTYSQDSKLSGDEPPVLDEVLLCILDNLSEAALCKHFKFDSALTPTAFGSSKRMVAITRRTAGDLPFLRDLVAETLDVMDGPAFGRTPT